MVKNCKGDKEISIKSGRCVKKCRSDQQRNLTTGRCVKKGKDIFYTPLSSPKESFHTPLSSTPLYSKKRRTSTRKKNKKFYDALSSPNESFYTSLSSPKRRKSARVRKSNRKSCRKMNNKSINTQKQKLIKQLIKIVKQLNKINLNKDETINQKLINKINLNANKLRLEIDKIDNSYLNLLSDDNGEDDGENYGDLKIKKHLTNKELELKKDLDSCYPNISSIINTLDFMRANLNIYTLDNKTLNKIKDLLVENTNSFYGDLKITKHSI